MKTSIFTPLDINLKKEFGPSFGNYSNNYGANNPEKFNGICRFCDTYSNRIRVAYKVLDNINDYRKVNVNKTKFQAIIYNFVADHPELKMNIAECSKALYISIMGDR